MSGSCVLFSGGLDSAVLVALERESFAPVWPIHVRAGLAWEAAEAAAIDRLLAAPPFAGRIEPLITLSVDMRDVYLPTHWAIEGRPPAYDTPDEDVYLEGRNIVLVAKAGVKCASLGVERLALGTPLTIATPLSAMHKKEVVKLGRTLGVPLELTLSCMNPSPDGRPCGRCSKCRERDDAFRRSGR